MDSSQGLPWWLNDKRICLQCRSLRRWRFNPWVGKIPWRREWQPTPVLLPAESQGQEEPGGLQSMGSQIVRHNGSSWACPHALHCFLRMFSSALVVQLLDPEKQTHKPGPFPRGQEAYLEALVSGACPEPGDPRLKRDIDNRQVTTLTRHLLSEFSAS